MDFFNISKTNFTWPLRRRPPFRFRNISFHELFNLTHFDYERKCIEDVNCEEKHPPPALLAVGVTISVITIFSNIFILATILSNKSLRKKWIFLNIVSLCLSDVIVGCFVVPLGLDYLAGGGWSHGRVLCKMYIILDISHFCLSSAILISICLERLLSKLQSVIPLDEKFTSKIFLFLFIAPWLFVVTVCLPILIIGEEEVKFNLFQGDVHCAFTLEESFFMPSITIMFVLPIIALAIVIGAMMAVYRWRGGSWDRLLTSVTEQEKENMRMSTIAAWVSGIFNIVFWLPYVVLVMIYATCKDRSCLPEERTSNGIYTLSISTSALSPWFWLITVEVRETLSTRIRALCKRLGFNCFNGKESTPNQWEYHTELLGDNEL